MPAEAVSTDAILSLVGAAIYETDDDGRFIQPGSALARFFLGPDASAEELSGIPVHEFYVIKDQRADLLSRLRSQRGEPVTELVLLKLHDGAVWCRCRSAWHDEGGRNRYRGLLLRLEAEEESLPGGLLEQTGWAYFQLDAEGRTTYASKLDAALIGCPNPIELAGRDRGETHWYNAEDRQRFEQGILHHGYFSGRVQFKDGRGRNFPIEIHARSARGGGDRASTDALPPVEAIWRDAAATDQAARISTLRLRNHIDRLDIFESAIVQEVAKHFTRNAAAYYRFDPDTGLFLLRATTEIPDGHELPRLLDLGGARSAGRSITRVSMSEGELILATDHLVPASRWTITLTHDYREMLVPIRVRSSRRVEVIGCLWVPLTGDSDFRRQWLRAFGGYLGLVIRSVEVEAAQRARQRALEAAVEKLLSPEGGFHDWFLKCTLEELGAEAGSVFVAFQSGGETYLRLKSSTGIVDLPSSRWDEAVYKVGEGLTGTMAAQRSAVCLFDEEAERRRRGISPARYVELLAGGMQHWLGCPIRNRKDELVGYVRVANRRGAGHNGEGYAPPSSPLPFSQGDKQIVTALAEIAGNHHDLSESLREHQSVIARSLHELTAPVVTIRSHASYLRKRPDSPLLDVKLHNIEVDAETLLDLLDTIGIATREASLRSKPTELYQSVIAPLRYGLSNLARSRGYRSFVLDGDRLRGLPQLNIDPGKMRQVFSNLIVNAIKYGPDREDTIRVQMDWIEHTDGFTIQVRDWGMGLLSAPLDKIFDQYVRGAEASDRDPTGSGVGLFVVRKVVELHGGTVRVGRTSHPTEFEIIIPKALVAR